MTRRFWEWVRLALLVAMAALSWFSEWRTALIVAAVALLISIELEAHDRA